VTKFCNEKNHNKEAPNMQNRICNFRSTEEVILFDSVDKNTAPMQSLPPSPKFTVVRKGGRVTCLVLDVSGSMGDMVTEASYDLFKASFKKFYFKQVKILIPTYWSKGNYSRVRTETYDKANIIIDEPNPQYGDQPYTLQYGECGMPGRYIHLTPKFLLDDSLTEGYGPRGRIFVHEWAHLRWGVYDEYDSETPFYKSGKKIEATRYTSVNPVPSGALNRHKKTSFCDKSSHNAEAPSKQNRICNYRSVQEVIDLSEDSRNSVPMEESTPPTPDFTGERILRQQQAATVFLRRIIEEQSFVGIVTFMHTATIRQDLTFINDEASRNHLINSLPSNANGGTDICAGLKKGFEVLRQDDGDTMGDEIVLLTDGESEITCLDEIAQSGAVVQTIALGPTPNEILRDMSRISGGKYFVASDNLTSNGLVDAFASLSTFDGDFTHLTIQIESSGMETEGEDYFTGTASVDKTVGNDTSFLVIYQTAPPDIDVRSPKGHLYFDKNFKHDAASKTMTLQIPGTAETGDWKYRIFNTLTSPQSLTMTVTSRASSADVAPVMVKAHMSQQSSDGSKPMVVFAEVSQKGLPVTMANVEATIVSSDGVKTELQLLDNGAGADVEKNDGIYSRWFINMRNGKYSLKVKVKGGDGKVKLNPPKPPINEDDLHVDVGNFTRAVTGESFIICLPTGVSPPNFPPNKITDFSAKLEEDKVFFTWTAPGADLDQGTAKIYEIRMGEDLDVIWNNFNRAHLINTASYKPQQAGSVEQYAFTPDNRTIQNGTTLYFAIRAEDIDSMVSDISNIAQVAKFVPFIPPPPPPPVKPTGKPPAPSSGGSVNITAIVISVTVVVVASS
ncbi:hypothetical protein JZ751_004285, partial [Albula glossodonta]